MLFRSQSLLRHGFKACAGIYIAIALSACLFTYGFAETGSSNAAIDGESSVVFASVGEGRKILTARDDFIERMSPFDRASRMKTDAEVSKEDFLRFVATNVLDWSDGERVMVNAALGRLKPQLEMFSLPFPKTIYLIKTTGNEEGGQQYTRQNAVVLNSRILVPGQDKALDKCIAHELFHVLSRQNPDLREKCYAVIGFQKCAEVILPSNLTLLRLTNPDAPRNDHYIEVNTAGKPIYAVPVLFSKAAKYDVHEGGEFFSYVQFKFLVVEKPIAASLSKPVFTEKSSQLLNVDQLSGFYEQIGHNTEYIVHPEEILADNFSMLVRSEKSARSPEVLTRLKLALRR
jgi:hypothetical protein